MGVFVSDCDRRYFLHVYVLAYAPADDAYRRPVFTSEFPEDVPVAVRVPFHDDPTYAVCLLEGFGETTGYMHLAFADRSGGFDVGYFVVAAGVLLRRQGCTLAEVAAACSLAPPLPLEARFSVIGAFLGDTRLRCLVSAMEHNLRLSRVDLWRDTIAYATGPWTRDNP